MTALAKNSTTELPQTIGRFEPIEVLGKGTQGIVYLAEDTQLGRKVAIKTLENQLQQSEQLNQEAKHVSQLSHPNIIPLYEIGYEQNTPFLVYEYCEGEQLKQRLQREGKLSQIDALKIVNQILDGIGYAHHHQIIHRDLNPSNLMIDNKGQIKIMDFGIAITAGMNSNNQDVTGAVNYLSPEQILNKELGAEVDIFATGLILYEMLTGIQAYRAKNANAIKYKISNEPVVRPSERQADIDKEIDAFCLKALAKEPEQRYRNAAEMQTALKQFLKDDDAETKESSADSSTVEFLLRRMKRKQDFPAISGHISDINQKTSGSDKASANELSNVILKDYALTTKLIRLVNSSFYGQFGGEITTVSRAVVILGYEQVRAAVLSIVLFEHLQNNEQANDLKNAAYTALMSGIIAREQAKVTNRISEDEQETCFVASMFHLLGKLLTIYYFPEDYKVMKTLISNKGMNEDQAMRSTLGVSYEQLGKGIAKEWKLPAVISNSMQRLPEGVIPVAKTSTDCIHQLSSFSNELCQLDANTDVNDAYEKLAARYKDALGINENKIKQLLESSIEEAEEFTRILNIDTSKVTVFKQLRNKPKDKEGWQTDIVDKKPEDDTGADAQHNEPQSRQDKQQDILVSGISEITNALLSDYNINDILVMVLETIYRGMGFNRVLFAIYDPKSRKVKARFGFGKQIDDIIPEFRYAVTEGDDVFVSTVKKGKEYIILDVNSEEYKHRVPQWIRKLTNPTAVVLYPLIVNKRCLGLIYADNDDDNIKISMDELRFFKTLRNQASLAIQQKRNS